LFAAYTLAASTLVSKDIHNSMVSACSILIERLGSTVTAQLSIDISIGVAASGESGHPPLGISGDTSGCFRPVADSTAP
jgi:hypothetical protein